MEVIFILQEKPLPDSVNVKTRQDLINLINNTFSACKDGDTIEFDFEDTVDHQAYISIINSMTVEYYNKYNLLFDVSVKFHSVPEKVT